MDDIRASYRRFPGWTQHFWTWQTGKALPGQQPLLRHTWASYLAVTLAVFLAGLGISAAAVAARFPYWYLALLLGWLLTVAGERMMVLIIAHQALHRRFSGHQRLDRFWGETVTVLSVFHTFQAFKEEHFDNHHRREIFATEADPPVQFLLALGFRPGLSRAALWRRAWIVFFSPAFYARSFASRLASNLGGGGRRRLAFAAWIGWWVSLPFWLPHGLLVLVLAFILPVIIFAQLSALLDRLGEHEWLAPRIPAYGHRFYTAANTAARFCGAPVPPRSMPFWRQCAAWARWTALTVCYHLPARLLVVVGDLPNHDYHHRYPSTTEWTTAAYARQRDIDLGPEGPPYQEVWGMGAAIDRLFRSLEEREAERMPAHIVDTFADARFAGNPAAVIEGPRFPAVDEMQATARQIGLPTTAFVMPVAPAAYRVRWFTPQAEINLCGHATIASARWLFGQPENADATTLRFISENGVLYAERVGDLIAIDLPAAELTLAEPRPGLLEALGTDALSCALSSDDVLVELRSADAVAAVRPDFAALARLPFRGCIVTAAGGQDTDFVSRTFFPSLGVNEDQVCVTAHCKLAPFWARRLGRSTLTALQLSERGGRLAVEDAGDRVRVLGSAVLREDAGDVGEIGLRPLGVS